jgi:GDPmannose 4,6-dehydratase
VEEQGVDLGTGNAVVRVDQRYFRPTEVDTLLGDPGKAEQRLGWRAETSFHTLVKEMVAADQDAARRDALVAREGFRTYQRYE